jgi:hypothetical protein
MNTSTPPVTTEEEPAIAIRLGFSSNPLRWLLLIARIMGFLFLILISSVWGVQAHPWYGFLPLALMLFLFVRFLSAAFGIDRSSYLFFEDRLEIDQRRARTPRCRSVHAYHDIGHMELASLDMVKLSLASTDHEPFMFQIAMNPRTGEDYFDEMVDHVQGAVPDHLFSILEGGFVRFTRECTLESQFPDHLDDVDDVRVDGTVLSAGERVYRFDRGWVFAPKNGGEKEEALFFAGSSHVHRPSGLVFATATTSAYREIVLELLDEVVFRIRGIDRDILLNDEPIGQLTHGAGNHALEWTRPQPAVTSLVLLTTFIANRLMLRV